MNDSALYYFAYGSNADPERFKKRVGPWKSRKLGWLQDYTLEFAAVVQSEGGAGAIISPALGKQVAGVVYEITPEQLAAMDKEEFDPEKDIHKMGQRVTEQVKTADGLLEVEVYKLKIEDPDLQAPSSTYLNHITQGLKAAGHDDATIANVVAIANQMPQ